MNTTTPSLALQVSQMLDAKLRAAAGANAPVPVGAVSQPGLLPSNMNWAEMGGALLESEATSQARELSPAGERDCCSCGVVNHIATAVDRVYHPLFPEEEPSLLRATMIDYVSRHTRSQLLSSELLLLFEQVVVQADQQYACGPTLKVRQLARDRARIRELLPIAFKEAQMKEAERLKVEIDDAVQLMALEHQCRYRLFAELFAISADTPARAQWLDELVGIDAALAAKTQKLDSIVHEALQLVHRYERISTELQIERYLPARIRFAYAQILVVEAAKTAQIRTCTLGQRYLLRARKLLEEAAFIDPSLIKQSAFSQLAESAGMETVVPTCCL